MVLKYAFKKLKISIEIIHKLNDQNFWKINPQHIIKTHKKMNYYKKHLDENC